MGPGSPDKGGGNSEKQTEPVELADVILNTLQGQRIYYPIGGEADTLRLPSRNGTGTFSEIVVPAIVFNGSQWSFSPDLINSSPQDVSINGMAINSIGKDKDRWAKLVAEMMGDFVVRYFDGHNWREVYILKVGGVFLGITKDQLAGVCQELVASFDEPAVSKQVLELQNRLIRLLLRDLDGQPEDLINDLTPGLTCEQAISMQVNQSQEVGFMTDELQTLFNLADVQARVDMLLDRFNFKLLKLGDEISLPLPQERLEIVVGGGIMTTAQLAYRQRVSGTHIVLMLGAEGVSNSPIQLRLDHQGNIDLIGESRGVWIEIPPSAPQARKYRFGRAIFTLSPVNGKLYIACNGVQEAEA